MNLSTLFAIAAQRTPSKEAIRYASETTQSALTYAELMSAADQLAAGLQKRGIGKGDRVAFYLGNRPEFVIAYLAVIRLGAVMVPINLRYRQVEIQYIVADSQPTLLITERAQESILSECGLSVDENDTLPCLIVEELDSWTRIDVSPKWPVVAADDLALIMYTSGTTGQSKGAMLTHNNVMASMTGLISAWAWEQSDQLLLCLPLFHTHGLTVGLHCALAVGATVLLREKFDTDEILTDLASGEPTMFFAVPTIYVRLVDALQARDVVDMSQMRLFCSGSAPLAAETHQAFEKLTGHVILERYGMTETGMNLSNPYAGPRVPGSVGLPLPGVSMQIVDDSSNDVLPGEEGQLLVRGSNVFDGYWRAPEKTADSFCHDELGRRWFRTGDLARLDPENGYVTLLGRQHELIISGGFNIYPREIEEVLTTFPGVAEAAVVGIPHAEWGEVPVAYIVCAMDVDEDRMVIFCRGQLASFKVPKQIHRVPELPRNAMGKLQKHLLKRG